MRLLPAAAALTLLAAALGPARAQEDVPSKAPTLRAPTKAEWKAFRKLLPDRLWLTDERRRKKARIDERWTELSPESWTLDRDQLAQLAEVLRNGSPHTTEKRREVTLQVATGDLLDDGTPEKLPVRVAVTTKYKPGCGRSFPLIISCHGGPCESLERAQVGAGTQMSVWKRFTSTLHGIVAAPALVGSRHGRREWTYYANVIDEIDRLYNVDRDRVMLTGHSWGGIVTWWLGPANADRFALLAPFICAGNPGTEHLANCRVLPIWHVQGNRDGKWIVETGRERRDALDELGYEHTYIEPNGGHDIFGTEAARIAKDFAERRRQLYAPHVVLRPSARGTRSPSDIWYWVRTYASSFDARCDRETNSIDVDIDGPFEVFLADEMLDLDRPVVVRQLGDVVFEGRVERSLAFTLEHVRETGDRARVFAASVRID
jgi:predicted esterase